MKKLIFQKTRPWANLSIWTIPFLVLSFLCSLRPIDDVDLLTQIRLGQQILTSHSLPSHEFLSYSLNGATAIRIGWLFQVISAALFGIGGFPLLRIVNALLFAGSFLLVATALGTFRDDHRKCGAAFFSSSIAFLISATSLSVRPQVISVFCLALVLRFLIQLHAGVSKDSDFFKLTPYILSIGLIWQNCHPSVSIGVLVALIFLVTSLKRYRSKDHYASQKTLYISFLLLLCQFITPDGREIVHLAAANFQISRDILQISEWLPAWDMRVLPAIAAFWLFAPIALFLSLLNYRKLSFSSVFLFLVFCCLSLLSARFVLFLSLVSIPLWFELFSNDNFFPSTQIGRAIASTPAILSLFLLPLLCFVVLKTPLLASDIPLQGIQKLEKAVPSGRIYNYREWAGPLMLFGSPAWKVAIDGRLYLYDFSVWQDYNNTASGQTDLASLISSSHPNAFFLHPTFQAQLISKLKADTHWSCLYEDQISSVFVPRDRD